MKCYHATILGTGSLGSFISTALSNLENIYEITIVDYDIVNRNNLKNSIYNQSHLGEYKVNALQDILSKLNPEIKINTYNIKYQEGFTDIIKSDIVIDCRDFTYNIGNEIDVRLYMSSRYLVVDCQKVKHIKQHEGRYISHLNKNDLRNAANIFTHLLYNGNIDLMIQNNTTKTFDIDYLIKEIKRDESIKNNLPDVIYSTKNNDVFQKVTNLKKELNLIFELNKCYPLEICMPYFDNNLTKKVININTIQHYDDIIDIISKFINNPFIIFETFVIIVKKENNIINIELIPNTAGA